MNGRGPVTSLDFDPDFAGPAAWAAMYRVHGLQVVPGHAPSSSNNWKRPRLADWRSLQNELVPDATFERWYGTSGEHAQTENMGLITGRASGNVFVVDLDEYKTPAARQWWQGICALHNYGGEPETWAQMTGGGGRQLFFRAPPEWASPTNKTTIGVDIRGQGGFAILPPSLHISGNHYDWLEGCAPWEMSIYDAPQWLLDEVLEVVRLYGGDEKRASAGPVERTLSPIDEHDAFGARVDGREAYMRDFVWAAVIGLYESCPIRPDAAAAEAAMLDAYQGYERSVKPRLSGATRGEALEREGRGVSAFRSKWSRAIAQWNEGIARGAKRREEERGRPVSAGPAPEVAKAEESSQQSAPTDDDLIPVVSAFPIDGGSIPRRDWIIPGTLLRRHLAVLVAPPGSGKSLITLQTGISVATGTQWGGWQPRKPTRTFVINAEDDVDEMRRRAWAAAIEMGVSHERLAGELLLAEQPESIVIARTDSKSKTVVRTPLLERVVKTVAALGVGLVIVDPFAETFEGDENANSEVKWAGIAWREVARRTGCAVWLVHHTKKYANGMAGDADASRGGGALIGTARIVATLFGMSEDEAVALDIDKEQRTRFVRFDDAKANQSLVTGVARWFEKVSMTLPNASAIVPGDEVGVLRPWRPPGLMDGYSDHQVNDCLSAVDRGVTDDDGQPTGALYSPHKRAGARWAGSVVAMHFACDEDRASLVVKAWLKSGLLAEVNFHDGKQERRGLKVDGEKRPGWRP